MNKETELMHEINLKLFANEIFKEGIYYIKIEKNLGCEIVLKEVKKDGCGIIYSFEILKNMK